MWSPGRHEHSRAAAEQRYVFVCEIWCWVRGPCRRHTQAHVDRVPRAHARRRADGRAPTEVEGGERLPRAALGEVQRGEDGLLGRQEALLIPDGLVERPSDAAPAQLLYAGGERPRLARALVARLVRVPADAPGVKRCDDGAVDQATCVVQRPLRCLENMALHCETREQGAVQSLEGAGGEAAPWS